MYQKKIVRNGERNNVNNAKNESEALDCIMKGLKYFLIKHPKKTVIVLLLIAGSMLYIVYDHVLPTKVRIEEAKPIGMETSFSFSSQMFADDKPTGLPIFFDSKQYGYKLFGYDDTNYICKMLAGENKIIVFHKPSRTVSQIDFYSDLRKGMKK